MARKLQIPTAPVFEPLLHPSRYKGAHGGRGSGKSWFFSGAMIEEHIRTKTDSVCLREIQKSLQFSSKKLLEQTIVSMNAGSYFDIQDKVIKARNGGIIIFQGMQDHTAESIKSLEGFDLAWFEEAQNASNKSLTLLRPTIRKPGSEIWFSWNRFKDDDPIELLLCGDNRPEGAIVVEANWRDNPWITAELLQEMKDDRRLYDADKFANIWEGKCLKNSEGDYFKNEMAKVRESGRILTIPKLDFPVNTFWDIGKRDGTAIWYHQSVGMEDRFIGYYECHDEDLATIYKELQGREFIYNKHFMPHDASHKKLSIDNKSVKAMLEDLGLQNAQIVDQIQYLNLGIQMTKKHFPTACFDSDMDGANGCKLGVKRLDGYRKKYNQRDQRWIDEPDKKNGCSEGADAFRQWAQAKEAGLITMAGRTAFKRKPGQSWRTA
jgi:phage terminase large subunit